jgi:tetratricopeptide (TPR) repeat protein
LAHVVETELESLDEARHLWKLVHRLWPDHVEALERRIEINRKLGAKRDLAQDLEAYADLLLDPNERFRVLRESGLLHHEIGETDAARVLLTQAIAIAESADVATDKVDEVRRALQALTT